MYRHHAGHEKAGFRGETKKPGQRPNPDDPVLDYEGTKYVFPVSGLSLFQTSQPIRADKKVKIIHDGYSLGHNAGL